MSARCWHIYFLETCSFTLPPKPKLAVLVAVGELTLCILINSEIDYWIRADSERLAAQLPLNKYDFQCLEKDCFLDCSEVFVVEEHFLNEKSIRDPIPPTVKKEIKSRIQNCKTVIRKYQKLIANS